MRICAILLTKTTHLSRTKFFLYKPLLLLSSTYDPFHSEKFKKNLTMQALIQDFVRVGGCVALLGGSGSMLSQKIFKIESARLT